MDSAAGPVVVVAEPMPLAVPLPEPVPNGVPLENVSRTEPFEIRMHRVKRQEISRSPAQR